MNFTKPLFLPNKGMVINPKLAGFLAFLIFSSVIFFIILQQYGIVKKAESVEVKAVLQTIEKTIESTLRKNYVDALVLALTINDKGVPEKFEEVGRQIFDANVNIDAVQLAPDGIIRYVYPIEGNKAAIGLDLLEFDALKNETGGIRNGQMYFAGPLELKQGGEAIVGRIPVYKQNKLWGFSVVVVRLSTLLKIPEIEKINSSKYDFQISRIDPITKKESFFFSEKQNLDIINSVSTFIQGTNWKLYLVNKEPVELLFPFAIYSFIALLIASVIGFLTTSFLKKPIELKRLLSEQAADLLKNELKLRGVFNQAALGINYIDSNTGKFVEVNKKFCDLIGYSAEELKQMDSKSIIHPDDVEEALFQFNKLLEGKVRKYTSEKRYVNKSGEIVWGNVTVSSLWAKNDAPSNHLVIFEDITEQKNAQKEILDSQQKIALLIKTIDGIVWESDTENLNFTLISEKVKDILGYTTEEWMRNNSFWKDHIHPEDREDALNFSNEQKQKLKNHNYEYRMIAKNGSIVWLKDIVNVIVKNGKAESLSGIMTDITRKKEIEEDLNNSFTVVSEQNRRLLNFSHIVSHNLRSHTSNITSIVEIISNSDSEEEKDEMVKLLKLASGSLNETMLNLNEVMNIQNNVGLIVEKINLKEYVDNSLSLFSHQIELEGIIINITVADDVEVDYNPAYLESVLFNLISNAIRYRDSGKISTINIDFFMEDNKQVLRVSDNGIGIDLDKNGQKLFGMYKTFSSHKDSKGIGLFITKNQIEAMGGDIVVESILDEGTSFKIYIL